MVERTWSLARRLAWSLGAEGRPAVAIERPAGAMTSREAVELELADAKLASLVVVVDDLAALDEASRQLLAHASAQGAKLVLVATKDEALKLWEEHGL